MSNTTPKPPRNIRSNAETAIIEALHKAMAETAVVQQKAQIFHWNVTGLAFGPLHALFGQIYQEHFAAMDELAERVKALGGHAEGRFADFLARSSLKEHDGQATAQEMLRALQADQASLSKTLTDLAGIAEEADDVVTNDMAIARAEAHDKFAWMLGAHLEG
jgi:starvation-inducible DNA-binding protein